MQMNLPQATHLSAAISGFSLTFIIGIGEIIGGNTHIVLGIIGTIWFVVSSILYVAGRDSWDWINGKRTYWQVFFTTSLRGATWFCSGILGMLLLRFFANSN